MPIRYPSDPELALLSSWPDEIAAEDAVTYITRSTDDLSRLAGFNQQENRLGVCCAAGDAAWLGWIPDDLTGCAAAALGRLAWSLASPERLPGCDAWTRARRGLPALLGAERAVRRAGGAALR